MTVPQTTSIPRVEAQTSRTGALRLSWTQPEDLVAHAINAAGEEGRDLGALGERWSEAGGSLIPAVTGATPLQAEPKLRSLARELMYELDLVALPEVIAATEPDDLEDIRALLTVSDEGVIPPTDAMNVDPTTIQDRIHGAWLGRAAGCLLGKPVEKIPRDGIRLIAQSTANWPIASYFTEVGLDPAIADRFPWNRRSRSTSLIENIDGMPEDDDLNFPLIALDLLERVGRNFTTRDVAESWLANLPGGRVFTAERITYRNLLNGYEPEEAGAIQNPFREWIGAQIRADVYGWVNPGRPGTAAELAWRDARLSHRRNGVYGAMFVAAASASAIVSDSVDEVLSAALEIIPPDSRYATAIRFGMDLGRSTHATERALDLLYAEYGHLHWVHVLNNAALLAFSLVRGAGDFETTITLAVTGGWDTDSTGATAGSITGALTGARGLPGRWVDPLKNRLATSLPAYDQIGFDELAARTATLAGETTSIHSQEIRG
ncbi:ADP-ribosylglycohydrolase family protein [Cryobacterium sp. Hh11]|uniref:ADP-ribosylglycohydrolase family protein n=1 Tax=Cryobacterium sp. Hh11 TaxID=2555868 RepID=UPI00106A8E71|nr:ADP-ribosylglycohydrolase family protein [Cryobacterium sp. Hh11]TFD54248.1 ADP-ribosylglycohydrolase family protein [Cryobacterium sp. Hh11]